MVIALVGIIAIQWIWVKSSYTLHQDEFSAYVNESMNKVNDDIDEDESMFFLEEKFGGVDSLLHHIVVVDENSIVEDHLVEVNPNDEHKNHRIEIKYSTPESPIVDIEKEINALSDEVNEWDQKLEMKLSKVDSLLEANVILNELEEGKLEHVSSIIQHFTYEKMLSGELKDRISYEELQNKLRTALNVKGIYSPFEFAVYNTENDEFEDGFISDNFDQNLDGGVHKKQLFQSDKVKNSGYELTLQFANQGEYEWNAIRKMAILSILFTILILLCFGYSLYFIFKQKKISQIKNDFINNMTHELKTPLASISLAASSIKHPSVIDKHQEIERYLGIIESEKDRINAHIEHVLDVAALDKGEIKLNFAKIDLIQLINSSVKNVELSLAESDGVLNFNCNIDSAPMEGDEYHLINVFTNVLDNSIKYRSENVSITIDLSMSDKSYLVSISDNGIGMNSKTQKLAFDKFFRAETGNIHNRKGFGLGLSYVKSMVEAHHGAVDIKSELNNGTTVAITLPKTI
jgi:two-component system, OmpR family, phosphate regulon sensor histidine kinase PhoR